MAALRSDRRASPDVAFALSFATAGRLLPTPTLAWAHFHSPKGRMVVRTGGLEPPRAEPDGFSYQLRLSPPSGVPDVCGLDYPFTMPRERGLGAARLVSTPSATFSRCGLARDCQLKGFPEFEQFCIAGFPVSTQHWSKSVASTDSATSAQPTEPIEVGRFLAKQVIGFVRSRVIRPRTLGFLLGLLADVDRLGNVSNRSRLMLGKTRHFGWG